MINDQEKVAVKLENEEAKMPTAEQSVQMPLRSQLKDAFINWLENSSSHGLPKAVKADNIVTKLLWFSFFTISLGGCAYFFISTLINYAKYQPVVQISVIQEYPTLFPAVTICNLNRINLRDNDTKDYINSLLVASNYSFIASATTADQIQAFAGTDDTDDILTDLLDTLKRLIATDTGLTLAEKQAVGFNLELDMLVSCKFNGVKCRASDFSSLISYEYGNCWTFNSGFNSTGGKQDILKTSETGNKNGLHLEILVGDPTVDNKYTTKSGLFLVVHNQTKIPLAIDDGDGMNIATGQETYVSVKREFRSKLEKPYSNCVKDLNSPATDFAKTLFTVMKNLNLNAYDQALCYDLCYQDKLIDRCKCADSKYPLTKSGSYCTSTDDVYCMYEYQQEYSSVNIEQLCTYSCTLPCDSVVYEATPSSATYPTDYYIKLLSTKKDFLDNFVRNDTSIFTNIKSYLMKVIVNYNDLSYVSIQEVQSTTVESLVGNVGGLFGLFIGLSLLSIVEIIELVIQMARITWLHKQSTSIAPALKT